MVTVSTVSMAAYRADFSCMLAVCSAEMEALAEKVAARPPTDLQSYVLERLNGVGTAIPFLDDMPLFAAIRTCEMLGTAACFGGHAKRDGLDPARLRTARIRGFEIGGQGKFAIEGLLREMTMAHAGRRPDVKDQVARQAFSAIYSYLHVNPIKPNRKGPALASFRGVVSDFIKANFPLKSGDNVLGEVVAGRTLHSVTSLAKEARCGPNRVKNALLVSGLIRDDQAELANANILFDAALGARMLQESRSALTYDEAAIYLGTGPHLVKMLVKANFIELTKAARLGQHGAVHVATLDAFLDRILKDAHAVKRKSGLQALLREASMRAMCTQADIVKFIAEGRLKWIGVREGLRNLQSILVDWHEVRSLAHGLGPLTISLRQFADRVRVRKQAAGALVAHDHVASVSKMCGGHRTVRIPVSEAIGFQERYVSLGELAKSRDQHHQTAKKTLDQRNVQPAFDPETMHAHIYLRVQTEL